jgi:nucleotide-binding universal stress UspA family protein
MFNDATTVVPWDFSKLSHSALKLALEKTSPKNIHVLCMLERPEPYTLQWGEEKEAHALTKCAEEFWDKIEMTPDSGLHFTAEFGTAASGIVDFAKRLKAGVILMSTHGRSGIAQAVMGSVAKRVMQSANCPVLLLPPSWCNTHTGK